MKSNLAKRFVTALAGAIIIISSIAISRYSYGIVFFLIMIFSTFEFVKITRLKEISRTKKWMLIAANAIAFLLSYGIAIKLIPEVFSTLGIIPLFFLFAVGLWGRSAPNYKLSAILISGHAYIGIPLMLLNYIYLHKEDYWPSYVIALLLFVWANDVAAYFVGRYFGKTKLNVKVSPKKTVEGLLGGLIFTPLFALGYYLIYSNYFESSLSMIQWMLFGLIASFGANFGDLVGSSLKRSFHVKDSSNVLPGHGGFIDRFDGFFIAAVFIYAYLSLLGIIHT